MSLEQKECDCTPRLRFPEFLEDRWFFLPLGQIAVIRQERVENKKCILLSVASGVGLISQKEKFGKEIAGKQLSKYFLVYKNDFVYNKSATKLYPQGSIYLYSKEQLAAVPSSIFICFFVKRKVNVYFLNYLFQYNLHGKWLRKFITVGARAHGSLNIETGDILSIPIPLPNSRSSLAEQQKIADCLSSLDELIEAREQKCNALRQHKKGLMQRLFPAEGETTPRWRFPEYCHSGDWYNKKISSIATVIRGASPRPIDEYISNDPSGLNWLKIGDVKKESKYIEKTGEKILPIALSKTRQVFPGDLILSNSMSFGRPYILRITACIHDGWLALIDMAENVTSDFLYYAILSDRCQSYFNENAAGAVVQNLNAEIIKNLLLNIPSLPEQQKIADCLSAIDERIAAEEDKIAALREHRKGLMQQLFPVM